MILESGAKARTIKKYLGKEWIVDACNGHVQDLPNNGSSKQSNKAMWASKEGFLPEPPWAWTERAERVISKMIEKAKKKNVEEIYIATDPDREGEFIAWRLKEIFSDFPQIKRVTFNEITQTAVQDAMESPREIDMNLVNAAKVRRFMDRLVGFRCSRFSRSWSLASMGRVQTPTLGFIVDREIERDAHVPIPYHSVQGDADGVTFKVRFHEKDESEAWTDDGGKHHPDRTSNSELADNAIQALNEAGVTTIVSVKEGKVNRKPQPPFTTDTLLRTASSRLGWSIARINRVATSLYQSGHITYIRTDSTRTSESARKRIRKIIDKEYGEEFLGLGILGKDAKKGAKNVQDAHEAIRPTSPESKSLDDGEKDQQSLYRLIWARFAASQMSDSIRERRDLTSSVENLEKNLYGTASWRIHAGWEAVYSDSDSNPRTEPPTSGLEKGSVWKFSPAKDNPRIITDETKPPRRFSESSIIQAMKNASIGRPSTYLTTVTKLINREYVIKDGASLSPSKNGRTLWLEVAPFYNEQDFSNNTVPKGLFTPEFTAYMEMNLDNIEAGNSTGFGVWDSFVVDFREMHNKALEIRKKKPTPKQLNYIVNRISRMSEEDKTKLLNGKDVTELSGEEAHKLIDSMNADGSVEVPASEKQIALIVRLVDKLNLEIDSFLAGNNIPELDQLTGGRSGTASNAISLLIEMDKDSPATEKQISAIQSMCESLEMKIPDAMALVNTTTIEEITKSDASSLIGQLKKLIQKRRRKKKK